MHHHKQWVQVQSNSHVHQASQALRDKVLQPQVKFHHFRLLNSSLHEYLFIEHIADLDSTMHSAASAEHSEQP